MRLISVGWVIEAMDAGLRSAGLSQPHRQQITSALAFASLRGIDTHGIPLYKTYLEELATGRAVANPVLRCQSSRPGLAHLDAGGALGIVAGAEAARIAVEAARATGAAVVVVGNSNHFGAASFFAHEMARQDMVGIVMSNSDALVVPAGGRRPLLGTNPIAMAAPGVGEELFCCDLATSQGSFLKSLRMRERGEAVGPGLLVDESGRDVALGGGVPAALLPLGGHKGQCLGMMVSILCAVLGGGPHDWQIPNLYEPPFDQGRRVSHFFLAMDLEAAGGAGPFRQRLSQMLKVFREVPAADGAEVTFPGHREALTEATRRRQGLPIEEEDLAVLERSARA
jgi:ureidoglycolate dehydrogenase (NAD+)